MALLLLLPLVCCLDKNHKPRRVLITTNHMKIHRGSDQFIGVQGSKMDEQSARGILHCLPMFCLDMLFVEAKCSFFHRALRAQNWVSQTHKRFSNLFAHVFPAHAFRRGHMLMFYWAQGLKHRVSKTHGRSSNVFAHVFPACAFHAHFP